VDDVVKCLVWDLDNTLWSGTLLESADCRLRPGVRRVLTELDRRGVLQSVASRNDPDHALRVLERKGIRALFLHPQIGWDSKVRNVVTIAERLGIALDAVAFIDDEPFERAQVQQLLPDVRTYPAEACRSLPALPEFSPATLSSESRRRRRSYVGLDARDTASRTSGMSQTEFLAWCATKLTLRPARPDDVPRIQELLQRTHQLNATGIVWSPGQIREWLARSGWRVFVAELRDRFVDYGRIGVAACRCHGSTWELVTFLLSCRVLSRGIAGFFLAWVRQQAGQEGAGTFHARFRRGERNHLMEQLFRLAGLSVSGRRRDGTVIYGGPVLSGVRAPRWLTVDEGGE
jgi:methoxymalonate biosynthesis protein